MKISVFGATGFIGSRFCEMYPRIAIPIPRDQNYPASNEILYFISTTHNYNKLQKDVEVNLGKLSRVLTQLDTSHTFNFISSWFVYQDVKLPAMENSLGLPRQLGNYAQTKLMAESLVCHYCTLYKIPFRIFRLANVFGIGDSPSKHKNALQYLINEMRNNRDIELYYGGKFYRDYIHVDDVCGALMSGMNLLPKKVAYNIGSGIKILFRDFIDIAHAILKSESKIAAVEPTEFHSQVQVKDFWMDVSSVQKYGICEDLNPYIPFVEMLLDEMEN